MPGVNVLLRRRLRLMLTERFILWVVIWACFSIVACYCNDSGLMIIPSFGMAIWFLNKQNRRQ